jgi:hypothetical protein
MRAVKARKQMSLGIILMLAFFVLTLLFSSGCARGGKYINEPKLTEPEQLKALVTFIRPDRIDTIWYGGAIAFGIWDGENAVGVLGEGRCLQHERVPGEHYFFGQAGNWSCVKADLAANRHYVIKAKLFFRPKGGVVLEPVTKSDYEEPGLLEQVQKWIVEARPVTPDPERMVAYSKRRRRHVLKAQETFQSSQDRCKILASQDYIPE